MSVWRIQKVDAQTRALAEAAAKAAGLPLGVWLERAILRRVEGRTTASQPLPPIAPDIAAAAPEDKADISAEMQAALEAAERRRRERSGDGDEAGKAPPYWGAASTPPGAEAELADPFATPEKISEESPFEQPPAPDAEASSVPGLTIGDEAISLAADSGPAAHDALETKEPPAAPEDEPLPPLASDAGEPSHEASAPSWEENDAPQVTTTARESLALPLDRTPRRTLSSLPLVLGGLLVVLAIAGAAYVFLVDVDQPPEAASTASTSPPPAPEPAKAVAQAATQPAPASAAPAPSASAAAPSSPPTPPADTAAAAAAAAPPPDATGPAASAPAAATPVPPQTGGPSIVNLALGGSAPQPPAPATPPPAATAPLASSPEAANEALPALSARAEAGDLEAQVELGRRYIQGIGVGRNEVEASKWLLRAAQQGHAQAQFNVGVMYERGVGLEHNLAKAIEFYRKAAAQNTSMAMHNLGLLYVSGQPGITADPALARRLMTQAAELDQIESQYSLALMHLQGVGGPIDKVTAMAWMALAARPNQPQLIEAAKQLSAQLSPAEQRRAQQLADTIVRRVQANLQKLQAAGAGPQAVTAMPAAATPARATPRVIDRAAIAEMQGMLASLKIYAGNVDGAMGPRTAAAIREFQSMAGMPVDGKPSVELLENLRDVAGLAKQ